MTEGKMDDPTEYILLAVHAVPEDIRDVLSDDAKKLLKIQEIAIQLYSKL